MPVVSGVRSGVRPVVRPVVWLTACLVFSVLLSACGPRRTGIADLATYPQNAAYYLGEEPARPLLAPGMQAEFMQRFRQRFFAPWHSAAATVPADNAFWGSTVFAKRTGYAENLQPWTLARWEALVAMQVQSAYPSMARRAITTRNADLRVMPTNKPFFYDARKAGEGYPFDYMQNSALWIGTPLLVTHVSADGAWYFVEAGLAYGWLPADAFGWADDAFCDTYMRETFLTMVHDDVPLRSTSGTYLGMAHVGALFPQAPEGPTTLLTVSFVSSSRVSEGGSGAAEETSSLPFPYVPERSSATGLRALIPVRSVDGAAVAVPVSLSGSAAVRMPEVMTPQAIAAYANRMMGQPYGWGGLLENRDCSATMHDLFVPFGLWLPRNSSQQGKNVGTLIPLDGMDAGAKRAIILEQGVPFYSLIWFKGHIGLYLGRDARSGEPLLLHNVWGARTEWRGEEGRAVIGRLAITSLRFAEERDDVRRNWFYDRMQGLVLLPSSVQGGLPETP